MMRGLRGALLDSVSATRGDSESVPIAPVPRPPLPPFPICNSCTSPYSYDQTLPWDPPTDDRDFLRANAWAVTVPGLPWVPGSSSEFPERFLSYLGFKYSKEWQTRGFTATVERAYSHTITSWANFRDEHNASPNAFVDWCGFVKRYVPYNHVMLASKNYDPRDMTPQQYADRFGPVLDALLKANVMDEVCPAWEMNLFNYPGEPTIEICKWVGNTAKPGVSTWLHFSPEVTSWFADGDERGRYGFWDDVGTSVDGIDYQTSQYWDIGEMQSHLVDTLNQFAAQGHRHKLRAFELIAMSQFSGEPFGSPHPDEDDGDMLGYLCCCTKGPAVVWGYGNGARHVDGSPL
jgi:hypothetical protein